MSGLAQASCQLTRVRDANSRSAKRWPRNRTKYSYDANGNAITRQGSTISWSSYNYPATINAGSGLTAETVAFSYGPFRQRWQQMYSGNSTQETTNYIGGLLEVVTGGSVTDYRHYINVAGERVAVYSRKSSGTNAFSYLLSDHQASVASITNSSGAQVVGESFDAFGSRRNPTTWSGAPSNSDLTTIAGVSREGYTFQTALGLWMGLNHLNGRVEDSITGRFLSADPYVPDMTNSQNYNRFSYVINNPFHLIDPTGFDEYDPGAVIAPTDGTPADGSSGDGSSGDGSSGNTLEGVTVTGHLGSGSGGSGDFGRTGSQPNSNQMKEETLEVVVIARRYVRVLPNHHPPMATPIFSGAPTHSNVVNVLYNEKGHAEDTVIMKLTEKLLERYGIERVAAMVALTDSGLDLFVLGPVLTADLITAAAEDYVDEAIQNSPVLPEGRCQQVVCYDYENGFVLDSEVPEFHR